MITGQERYFIVYELMQQGLSKAEIGKRLELSYSATLMMCMKIEVDMRKFSVEEYFLGREMAKELLLSLTVYCSLLQQRIYTVDEFVACFRGEVGNFRRLKGIGPKTYSDLVERLSMLGYDNPSEYIGAPIPAQADPNKWEMCLEYWDYKCAVCGANHQLHQDHWVPRSAPECPGAEPTNMVPLCNECNLEKSDVGPYVWLVGKLGQIAAQQKMIEIFNYFDWWRSNHGKNNT